MGFDAELTLALNSNDGATRDRLLGHDTIAPHLPVDDDTATFEDYAQVVIDTIGDRRDRAALGDVAVAEPAVGLVRLAPLVGIGERLRRWD